MTAEEKTNDSRITLALPHGDGNPRNSEGAFERLQDGRIMFAWSRYRGESWADAARADIAAIVSSDGGMTWSSEPILLVTDEGAQNVMSASLLRLQDGRLALFYLRKNGDADCLPRMRVSDDDGDSWSDSIACSPIPGYSCLLNDQAVQLSNGRIVLPVSYAPGLKQGRNEILCFLSDDAGDSWHVSQERWRPDTTEDPHAAEPVVVERGDGSLYCCARTTTGRQWQSSSTDQGETWSTPEPSVFESPAAPMNIKPIPGSGDWLAVWDDLSPRWELPAKEIENGWAREDSSWGRTPLVLAVSRDQGETWEGAKTIETDPDRGFCYPAIGFVDDAVLLAYCCGGRGSAVLQDLCIRRLSKSFIYAKGTLGNKD